MYEPRQNLVMLLTPPGVGAIAVVRVLGPRVAEFLRAHFSRPVVPDRCLHGQLKDGSVVLDDPVVVLHGSGNVADINVHGGVWVVQSVLDLSRREGFELIDSSSFPLHPALVDAESTLDMEVQTHLPLARTEQALRMLLAQPRAWHMLQSRNDIPRDAVERIIADRSLWWMLNMPRVAIVGPANVGKSTLANQLFAQEHSITADVPGTTRDWVGEIANLDGLAVLLVDTPGQRDTSDDIERVAIDRSREQIVRADLIVLVFAADETLDAGCQSLLATYSGALRVVNKVDRPAKWDVTSIAKVRTVATTGTGIDELRRAIRQHFGCERYESSRPRWWTQRQLAILRRAIDTPDAIKEI